MKAAIPGGPSTGSSVGYKFTSAANYKISMEAENMSGLFDGGGLGVKTSKYKCSVTASDTNAVTLTADMDLTLFGNGVSFATTGSGGVIKSLTGSSNLIGAAGQTLDQLKARCHKWGQSFMKSQIDGSLMVSAALNVGKYTAVRSRSISKPKVKCLYNRSWNKPYDYDSRGEHVSEVLQVSFDFKQDGIYVWVIPSNSSPYHSITAWANLQSYPYSYSQFHPWLKKIYDKKLGNWELATLLNKYWVPRTNQNRIYAVSSNGALHKCWEIQYYPYTDPLKD